MKQLKEEELLVFIINVLIRLRAPFGSRCSGGKRSGGRSRAAAEVASPSTRSSSWRQQRLIAVSPRKPGACVSESETRTLTLILWKEK
ncbi:hypothetical protein EYF80_061788 [Liparis tanakae]|uniref:Uncharacterized protein n=1 Tax=Liparis tanakae TaxID=230148 RepID=A0A4Z2EI84_9TELE|nr:hypothetical protein EYF80_061788 [Liparis tanakae]